MIQFLFPSSRLNTHIYKKLLASMVDEAAKEKYLVKALHLSVQCKAGGQNGAAMFIWIFHGRPY